MTPEDWRKGMENEAASVEDGVWAGEAKRAARAGFIKRTGLVLVATTLIYVLIGSLMVMAFNAVALGYDLPTLRLLLSVSPSMFLFAGLVLPLTFAAFLAWFGVRPALIWIVPIGGAALGAVASQVLTIGVSPQLPSGAMWDTQIDLLPAVSGNWTQLLSSQLLKVVATAFGIWLGRLLSAR